MLAPVESPGIIACLSATVRSEGLTALTRGLSVACLRVVPFCAIDLALYSTLKEAVTSSHPRSGGHTSAQGAATCTCSTCSSTGRGATGAVQAAVLGFGARGDGGSSRGAAGSSGRRTTADETALPEPPSALALLACGATSSAVAQLATYPLAVLCTRMQISDSHPRDPRPYRSLLECALATLPLDCAVATTRSLYRGLLPNMVRSVPSLAVSYLVFEQSKLALQRIERR